MRCACVAAKPNDISYDSASPLLRDVGQYWYAEHLKSWTIRFCKITYIVLGITICRIQMHLDITLAKLNCDSFRRKKWGMFTDYFQVPSVTSKLQIKLQKSRIRETTLVFQAGTAKNLSLS